MRSTQGLQFNQIQCGKVTGAASPSTLVFTKMIKVDLSPTRVDSLARTFILLLLSMILVKSFFFICEVTRPIVSMATVVLCKTRPMSMELTSWKTIKLSKLVKGLLFFAIWYAVLETRAVDWKRVCSLCLFKFGNTWMHKVSKRSFKPLLELQNVCHCYFKNIDSFFMCLIVFVFADFFAQRS